MYSCFFFKDYCVPRDLLVLTPSVPTRRSSDLPASTAERWARQWGDAVVDAAAAAWSAPPPIDLSFADEGAGVEWSGVPTLAPRHRRLPRGRAVADMPGFRAGGGGVQDLAADRKSVV